MDVCEKMFLLVVILINLKRREEGRARAASRALLPFNAINEFRRRTL